MDKDTSKDVPASVLSSPSTLTTSNAADPAPAAHDG